MSPRLYCPTSLESDEVIDLPAAVGERIAGFVRSEYVPERVAISTYSSQAIAAATTKPRRTSAAG